MGRRKIEIKAIKDDRNRSVTFLKRKGGLFKKAHELSVLCSVDVAVIIFGSNKKLYEFSSGDIHSTLQRYHYSQPHEHKGPQDFADKDGGDDEDDEDVPMGTPPQEPSPPHHGVAQYPIHDQPHLQHMRQRSTPSASASPPMHNGAFPPHRLSTPQPPHPGSRPTSRNHMRRQSSNLVPQNHPHPQATQPMQQHPQYMYQQPTHYNQQHAAYMRATQGTPPMHHTPPMHPQHHYSHPGPPQAQMQHLYLQDQRRSSMPPQIPVQPKQEAMQHAPMMHTPPQPSRPFQSPPLPGHDPRGMQMHRTPEPQHGLGLMHTHAPHDMQPPPQQWQQPPIAEMNQRPVVKQEDLGPGPRPQSIDVGAASRSDDTQSRYGPPPGSAPIPNSGHQPSSSVSSMPAPSRVNSMQSNRPKLSVQIPGEATESGAEETADESSKEVSGKTNSTPAKPGTSDTSHHSNLVLPAPSPRSASAGAILSAGATGPANPFARPSVPKNRESQTDHYKDASPMSALPSRVMQEHGYMSSPSSMFPELGFGSLHGNNLASPAVYQPTPITYHGPSFRDEPSDKRKKSPGEDEQGVNKKAKSG